MIKISPSILSADFANLQRDIEAIASADYVHVDVMDGLFVPNISVGIPVLQSVRKFTDMTLDVHLMIDRPLRYVEQFAAAGADIINCHIEADTEENTLAALKRIRELGKVPAVTVKPKTPAEAVEPFYELCGLVLVMTVEPGFGGQSFIAGMTEKIRLIRTECEKRGLDTDIEVDGGITDETIVPCAKAGANVFVAGSYVFRAKDRSEAIARLREAAEKA